MMTKPMIVDLRTIKRYKYQAMEDVTFYLEDYPTLLEVFKGVENIQTTFISYYHYNPYAVNINFRVLVLKQGYAYDGMSGPIIDTKTSLRAALLHDVLYQLLRLGLLPEDRRIPSDLALKEVYLEDYKVVHGDKYKWLGKARAWYLTNGLQYLGKRAAKKGRKHGKRFTVPIDRELNK